MAGSKRYKYIFGPVASRRLGKSLGLDIVPFKTCTQNCLYCQLGVNADTVIERKLYVDVDDVAAELRQKLAEDVEIDYITISGSGEPTLNSGIGKLISQIKQMTEIPVAVITNGSLLHDLQVRKDIINADLIVPSLDAGDEKTFREINCQNASISFDLLVEGLIALRNEFDGQLWLEVFFCAGINDSDQQVRKISNIISRINPDKVQLNTSVRPTASGRAIAVAPQRLEQIAKMLGPNVEVIASFDKASAVHGEQVEPSTILDMLKRRPCSAEEIAESMGLMLDKVQIALDTLVLQNVIIPENKSGNTYYRLT